MGKWIVGIVVVFVLFRVLGYKMLVIVVGVLVLFIIIFGGMLVYMGEVVEDFVVYGKVFCFFDVFYCMGSWG